MSTPVIVCAPISRVPMPAPGSLRKECSECKEPVWVGPETLIQAGRGAVLCCIGCALRLSAESDEPAKMMPPSELVMSKIKEGMNQRGQPAPSRESVNDILKSLSKVFNAELIKEEEDDSEAT